MKKQQLFTSLFLFFYVFTFSQTKEDAAKITRNYEVEKIQQKITYFQKLEIKERAKAIEVANRNNWPIIIKGDDGSFQELMALTPDGFPIYYATTNVLAARSTRTNYLNSGGGLGLSLDGQNMVARVWDGGTVRRTHNGFGNRVTTVDDVSGTAYSSHATHVTGTILALPWNGTSSGVKGMATLATARTFNWDNDESEALAETLDGMLISNHSYGVPVGSGTTVLPAWFIGAYTDAARTWDEIAYTAPYYLPVMSAGNDGNNNNNPAPIASGYDKLVGNKTAKNVLIIANATDATINADGSLSSVTINASSSQGPTDDRRIKPDIAGNGTGVLSTSSTNDISTASLSGTSMSGPNVAGTLLLVQEHHKNLTTSFMKSATLRGLACHTADDAGNAGPDAKFGWGLLNAKKAVETITANGLTSWVSEEELVQGQTFTMTVKSNGGASNPLIASITWTDLPGTTNIGTTGDNDATPVLVNDLDIRVTKDGTTYYPWKLQSSPSALAVRTGDNNVDNIEVVKIDNPTAGDYVITVTHKGTLVTGAQNYSLIVTGITSDFALTSNSDDLIVCSNQDAVYTFDYKQTGVMTTTFSAVGLPSGAMASFNPTSLSNDGTVTMTISGLAAVQPGAYTIGISGSNGVEMETRLKQLRVYSATFQPTTLTTPTNGQDTVATTAFFNWNTDVNAESYNLQVSTQSNFSSLFANINTDDGSHLLTGLASETTYYWRVIPSNRCGSAIVSSATVNNFRTGIVNCGNTFTATDFSNASIGATANSIASVPIQVTGGLTIGDINVSIDITHTYIQDMKYYLEGPASIGSPIITLFDEPCGDNDDVNCTLDDEGVPFTCGSSAPSITGTVKPTGYLTDLNNLPADGTWILRVVDAYNGDGGSINAVTLSVCNIEQSLSTPSTILSEIKVYPNPTKGILNIDLASNTFGESSFVIYDVQGRQVISKKSSNTIETLNVENLSEGIYMLTIENDLGKTTRKVVINK
ncbi:S8 family serine peptidase [Flavobacterium sp. LMO8]|uniref:S8 family serine peptidase n=1 Tax=Flavobacterium sp. LMO8 TaxID=2654244 RepID=UPI001291CED0|nr:S8 family serine peptidase [Flavobacterium sp. LMO8]MQP25044.1 S8 family serine peptidase [Flavobacterium sp. LMO8]